MSDYRLWFVKRGDRQQGPFPEPLICRHILLGRIGEQDQLSLDGKFWRPLDQLPELMEKVHATLYEHMGVAEGDVDWREERAKAALRWLDDRKSPDPRKHESPDMAEQNLNRRSGVDRRQRPETVEQHAYRESRSSFEEWVRTRRDSYVKAIIGILLVAAVVLVVTLTTKPVNPIKVGLQFQADCQAPASRGVNWAGCDKHDQLLVGVDLQGADLSGANLQHANLKYANLMRANLLQASLKGADLTGVQLGHAVWTDGRVCAEGSVGVCR